MGIIQSTSSPPKDGSKKIGGNSQAKKTSETKLPSQTLAKIIGGSNPKKVALYRGKEQLIPIIVSSKNNRKSKNLVERLEGDTNPLGLKKQKGFKKNNQADIFLSSKERCARSGNLMGVGQVSRSWWSKLGEE